MYNNNNNNNGHGHYMGMPYGGPPRGHRPTFDQQGPPFMGPGPPGPGQGYGHHPSPQMMGPRSMSMSSGPHYYHHGPPFPQPGMIGPMQPDIPPQNAMNARFNDNQRWEQMGPDFYPMSNQGSYHGPPMPYGPNGHPVMGPNNHGGHGGHGGHSGHHDRGPPNMHHMFPRQASPSPSNQQLMNPNQIPVQVPPNQIPSPVNQPQRPPSVPKPSVQSTMVSNTISIPPPHVTTSSHGDHHPAPAAMSGPPPSVPTSSGTSDMIPPVCPSYFDLPAGLMVPLVQLTDCDFEPIDCKKVQLPPPCPPSDRLLSAIDRYYEVSMNRNIDGWEPTGLTEFYKAKRDATKNKVPRILKEKQHEVTCTISDHELNKKKFSESEPEIKMKIQSTKLEQIEPKVRKKKSHKIKKPRSRSISPEMIMPSFGSSSSAISSMVTSPSTLPSMVGQSVPIPTADTKIDIDNKGHQMLMKMGWSGTGLGSSGQGIQEPISAGQVRSLYSGIGSEEPDGEGDPSDPFHSYRRQRGQAFMDRIQSRSTK